MITAPLKAELLEEFDKAHKELREMVDLMDDIRALVSAADPDLRRPHSLMVGELGNVGAQMAWIRARIEEVETRESVKKKEK